MNFISISCQSCSAPMKQIGELEYECPYCGLKHTATNMNTAYADLNRAASHKLKGDFQAAIREYEHIVEEDESCYLAYWGAFLADYGITYSKKNNEKYPVFFKSSTMSIYDNIYYRKFMQYCPPFEIKTYEADANQIELIRIQILKNMKKIQPEVVLVQAESFDSLNYKQEYALSESIVKVLSNQSIFWNCRDLKDVQLENYEPMMYCALQNAKYLIVVASSVEHANVEYVKTCWKRFSYMESQVQDRQLIFLPMENDYNEYPYDLRHAKVLDFKTYAMAEILSYLQHLFVVEQPVEEIVEEVVEEKVEVKKEKPKAKSDTSVPPVSSKSKEEVHVDSNIRGNSNGFGSIHTNSQALRTIADDISNYTRGQDQILNESISNLYHVSMDWDDKNMEQIIQEMSRIARDFEALVPETEYFVDWLKEKADILDEHHKIN